MDGTCMPILRPACSTPDTLSAIHWWESSRADGWRGGSGVVAICTCCTELRSEAGYLNKGTIVHVIASLSVGGAETFLCRLCNALVRDGWQSQVIALSNEPASEPRLLLIRRIFVPNVILWFPLIHEMSSVKLCTGVTRVRVRENVSGENTKRKLMEFSAESPCWLNASRVNP